MKLANLHSVVSCFPHSFSKANTFLYPLIMYQMCFATCNTNRFSSCVVLFSKLQVCKNNCLSHFGAVLSKWLIFFRKSPALLVPLFINCNCKLNHIAQLKQPGLPSGRDLQASGDRSASANGGLDRDKELRNAKTL